MSFFSARLFITCWLLCVPNLFSWAQESTPFHFFFQGVYSDKVTLNRVQKLFHDFSSSVKHPIHYNSGPSIDHIEEAIEQEKLDLLIWGYSENLNRIMKRKGFTLVTSSYIAVNIYQYIASSPQPGKPLRVATLNDSGALYSAKMYFANQDVVFTSYDNFFSIIEACFRREIDMVIAAKIFIDPQPDTIKKRFTFIKTLPKHTKIAVWLKSNSTKTQSNVIAQYFIQKQDKLNKVLGTKDFQTEY